MQDAARITVADAGDQAEWADYRALCDRPDVMSRWILERTAALFEGSGALDLAAALREVLVAAPLLRPKDHRGPESLDMFRFTLPAGRLAAFAEELEQLLARSDLAQILGVRSVIGFEVAWREFIVASSVRHDASARSEAH